jgi:hypothetical protein
MSVEPFSARLADHLHALRLAAVQVRRALAGVDRHRLFDSSVPRQQFCAVDCAHTGNSVVVVVLSGVLLPPLMGPPIG